jgi:hypothetical protein
MTTWRVFFQGQKRGGRPGKKVGGYGIQEVEGAKKAQKKTKPPILQRFNTKGIDK